MAYEITFFTPKSNYKLKKVKFFFFFFGSFCLVLPLKLLYYSITPGDMDGLKICEDLIVFLFSSVLVNYSNEHS